MWPNLFQPHLPSNINHDKKLYSKKPLMNEPSWYFIVYHANK